VNPSSLISRWRTAQGRDLADRVFARLAAGQALSDLSVGTHGGRADLRGLPLPPPDRVRRLDVTERVSVDILDGLIQLRDVHWTGLDLSHAQLPSLRMSGCVIVDCLFDEAKCRDWRLWRSEVSDSRFVACDLRDAAIGTWHEGRGNTWRRVAFRRADLRGALVVGARFDECDFMDARLSDVRFQQSTLEGCRFFGVMKDIVFDCRELPGKPKPAVMRNLDFRGATLEDVEFRGCRFENVQFPDDPGLRLVPNYPAIARRELDLLVGNTSVEARMLMAELQNALRLPGRSDSTGLFNRRDYVAAGGEPLADLAETVLLKALSDGNTTGG
jgi:uncharacterized protein YjbI with pentapeptide repeats